ncbi:MAG: amidohydrolase family protein [Desulfovibrio sp.]|jgi:cytosine/adenosine deaminase-related metal-dependent hydrolase|nr:amidohydrolase family protein [Desulfovibrio sp.]
MPTAFRARRIITLAGERAAVSPGELDASLRSVDNAVLLEKDGVILGVEEYAVFRRRLSGAFSLHDLGPVCLAPALINAHCHLELSHLAGKTRLGEGFVPWLASLMPLARTVPGEEEAVSAALRCLKDSGVGHCADVESRLPGLICELALREWQGNAVYPFTHFLELIGFSPPPAAEGEDVEEALRAGDWFSPAAASLPVPASEHCALSGHALYSTAPEALQAAHAWCRRRGRVFSLHLAESPEEDECLRSGSGALRDLLRGFQPSPFPEWKGGPVDRAEHLGLLDAFTLAVHCVRLTPRDRRTLAERKSAVCLCPRSNAAIGVGRAKAREAAASGILLCLGTDGLCSTPDLDMQNEMAAARDMYSLSARAVLRLASINGAAALRLESLGSLEKGKAAVFSMLREEFARELFYSDSG